jgi:hypothetical protein
MAIETQMPDLPQLAIYSGLIDDHVPRQSRRSGLVTATAGLIGRGETAGSTTANFGVEGFHFWRAHHFAQLRRPRSATFPL